MKILLVDDDAIDKELFTEVINGVDEKIQIHEASDGEEAINYLMTNTHLPDIIFLDLNMPRKDGRVTLKEIKAEPTLRKIPVCVLSTSNAQFEINNAYTDGANIFLVKPLEFKILKGMLATVFTLFDQYASLPQNVVKQ